MRLERRPRWRRGVRLGLRATVILAVGLPIMVGASAMAARMAASGRVTVSERKSRKRWVMGAPRLSKRLALSLQPPVAAANAASQL